MTPEEISEAVNYLLENDKLNKYSGTDNYKKPKSDYLNKLVSMSNKELLDECKSKIWLSAYAGNNPRSDFHWQCDACYDECQRREKPKIYTWAYDYHTKQI